MGWKLLSVFLLHTVRAAFLGDLEQKTKEAFVEDTLGPPPPVVQIERVQTHLGLCNAEVEDSAGFCVRPGSCYGEIVGHCGPVDPEQPPNECCKKTFTCGGKSHELISYFQNPRFPNEEKKDLACNSKVNVRWGVCQLRLDFLVFEFPTPDDKTGVCDKMNNMKVLAPNRPYGVLGGKSNHGFCGKNNGQHVYVPVSPKDQVILISTLSSSGKHGYGSKSAKWNIKITQIECNSEIPYFSKLEAPTGCLQYFTEPFGTLSSFNFDGSSKFAPDQDYAICISSKVGKMGKTCKMTLRANQFGMPVGGDDMKNCEAGTELVNPAKHRDCCNEPGSSYIGVVGCQPHPNKPELTATRRYWCGKELGSTGEIDSKTQSYVIKVWSGDLKADDLKSLSYDPIGFSIDYKLTSGLC